MQSELRSVVARALTGDPSLTVADLEHLLGSGMGLFRSASASAAPSLTVSKHATGFPHVVLKPSYAAVQANNAEQSRQNCL